MNLAPRVLLAMPVYNEESSIDCVLGTALAYISKVLVVDDGSTDGTAARLAAHPVEVFRHDRNLGYGRSTRDIFRVAVTDGYDWVLTMDCDEQHGPRSIPEFLKAIQQHHADVVSGSRYLRASGGDPAPGRRKEVNMTIVAEINARLGAVPAGCGSRPALGRGITDAFCGFKAYRTSALRGLSLDVDGYDFPLQFWVQAVAHGLRIDEIPVPRIYIDLHRSFGADLDDADRRLALYRATFERELARCADLLRARGGIR